MTRTYEPARPIWCAGCGHFGVEGAIRHAMTEAGVQLHETLVLAGIGCSGTVQNNIGAYGYHAMHGRVLPTAVGVALANPELAVIAAAGDGDGYAIGGGHLVHALKRNPNLLYVVMNNGVYGLTKGQDSPTREASRAAPDEEPLDAMLLGLSITGSTFLARATTTRSSQLHELMYRGLCHARSGRGMAFVEVLSPCVTYNDTYPDWMTRIHDVDSDPEYCNDNRGRAFSRLLELIDRSRIPVGLIYLGEHPTLQNMLIGTFPPARALAPEHAEDTRQYIERLLSSYSA